MAWWHNDLHTDTPLGSESTGASAGAQSASAWFRAFGVRLTHARSNPGGGDRVDYTGIDFAWRPIRPTRNNYLALAAGLERVQLDTGGVDDSGTGARLAAEGRVGILKLLYVYGEAAWFPRIGSMDFAAGARLTDVSGREYEFGAAFHAFPFLWVRIGYRDARTTGTTTFGTPGGPLRGDITLTSRGPLVAAAFQF